MIGKTMTKTVLYYGIILGLYYQINGVYSYEDDKYVKDVVVPKSSGVEISKSANLQDKIFIKSGYPLRGRKIPHTAWSKEDATEGTHDFKKTDNKLSDSWNIEKLINYLVSLVYKTQKTKQSEQENMIQNDPVMRILKNELKSERKSSDNQDIEEMKTEVSNTLDIKKKPHTFHFNAGYEEKYVENSESNESYGDESDEECEDSSSEESAHKHKNNAEKRHQDKTENNGKNVEDCYESVESDMESSNKISTKTAISNRVNKDNMISLKNEVAKRRMQSSLQNTNKDKKLPIPNIKVLNETVKAEEKPSITIAKQTNTGLPLINLKKKSTVMPHKTKNTGKHPLTKESDDKIPYINTHSTKDGYSRKAQLITSSNNMKNKGNAVYSTLAESNTHIPTTKSVTFLSVNSELPIREIHQLSTSKAQDILVNSLKGTSETLFLNSIGDKLKTTPPIKATNDRNQKYIKKPLNEHTDVALDINKTPIPMDKVHNKVSEFSKFEFPGIEKTEVLNHQDSIKDKVKITRVSQDASKISRSGSIFQNENLSNYHQQENKDQPYENKEDNLGNEFIQLNNISTQHNSENKSAGINVDYHEVDKAQHSPVTSENDKMNQENVEQETFDTILEFLYKNSNNSLILSLKNSSIF